MATRIDTVASRDKLKPRREPYWHRLRSGCYLGFRKMTSDGAGVWIARARDEEAGPTKQIYESLGDFGALPDHQRFDAASKAAQTWFEHLGRGGTRAVPPSRRRALGTSSTCARTRPTGQPTMPMRGSRTTS